MIIASSWIIVKDKKILLIKRWNYTTFFPDHRGCPGGRAEAGETPEKNVIREVKEEVNLDFEPTELIKKGIHKDRELFRFLWNRSGNIEIQNEEIAEYGWFNYEEASKLDLSFDYRDVIEILHKRNII